MLRRRLRTDQFRSFSTSKHVKSTRRALLYIPGSSEKMLAKSKLLKADGLTFDLEDSVAADAKPKARQLVVEHLKALSKSRQERIVRINSRYSEFAEEDLAALRNSHYDSIMIPKTQSPADICWLADRIPRGTTIIALIESAQAIMNLKEIATSHSQLSALVFAAEDYSADMNLTRTPGLAEMIFARQALVTAAKAYGLDAIDLVCTEYKDVEVLRRECEIGASWGFTGKQAIHPSQVDIIQEAFSPSAERIRWATALLKVAAEEKRGAFEFEGKMIDAPVLLAARQIIAQAGLADRP